ncbi:ankyrin [Calothrix parasitica NIES-267]|uniref:Ankyrin n=1 Tax=Calothrix parasitica NIES-267 TaxID=1973488 RepID=A0A1Z4LMY6_9CYAN|nr:ankyrin [Calothrix parasitica NIES-267]
MSISSNNESESNSRSIYEIIQTDDIAGVRNFITNGADINQVHKESGYTPLEIAAEKGELKIAKILIEAGAIVDNGLSEPLELAAYNGFTEIVDLLLQAGNYAEKEKNKHFYNAFFSAIIRGHIKIVKSFIGIGVDVNYLLDGDSGLCRATERCHEEIVEFLLEAGAEVNLRNGNQSTALMQAAYRASGEIARILIEKGADINAKDAEGQTPLIIAAGFGNAEVAGELILAGADIDAKDNNGHTALMYASLCESNDITEPIPDLEELEEISSESTDSFEDKLKKLEQLGNILSNIEITGRVNIAQMLRIAGASQQGLGINDLVKAAEVGNLVKVKNLIKAGVDINGYSPTGNTALIAAVKKNHINIAQTLIKAGADINLPDKNIDNTPLMEAVMRENTEIVRILIEAGADVNIHTDYEYTAFTRAQYHSNPEIIKLLKDAGARNYHEIPVSQWRGIDTIELNDHSVIVKASVEEVSEALYQIWNANIWQKDVFEKEIEITDICFIVFQFPGHSWTAIRGQNLTVLYDFNNLNVELIKQQWQNPINEQNAKDTSKLLKTKAIDFGCNDTFGAVGYSVFDSGELVEEFSYCCNSDFSKKNEKPAEDNECVIVTNDFYFRSQLRHISIDEIPQHERDDDDYFDDEPEIDTDEFKFVNDFIKSLDAYIPTWGGRNHNGAGHKKVLRVIGFDPEDIERMDFIAIS